MNRRRIVAIATGLGLLAFASVSRDSGHTLEFVDEAGRPVAGAYVVSRRVGYSGLAVAHPVSYDATPPALTRSDASGRVEIAATWIMHWPVPIQLPPALVVDLVYAPSLHNALVSLRSRRSLPPGVTAVSARHTRVQLTNLTDDPRSWLGTLGNLGELVSQFDTQARTAATPVTTRTDRDMLADRMAAEYAAYVARFDDVSRPSPSPPRWESWNTADDRRRWQEAASADLARDPTWGGLARRQFAAEIAAYHGSDRGASPR